MEVVSEELEVIVSGSRRMLTNEDLNVNLTGLVKASPSLIKTNAVSKKRVCPLGQYMPKDSKTCAMCLPSILMVDISRPVDLTLNSAEDIYCPSAFVSDSDVKIDCVLKDFLNSGADLIRAPGCKLPAKTFQNRQLYEMSVTFDDASTRTSIE